MKERYHAVCLGGRNGVFYCKDIETESRTSLHTKDRKEAEWLVQHKNEALNNPGMNRKIRMVNLSAADPEVDGRHSTFTRPLRLFCEGEIVYVHPARVLALYLDGHDQVTGGEFDFGQIIE